MESEANILKLVPMVGQSLVVILLHGLLPRPANCPSLVRSATRAHPLLSVLRAAFTPESKTSGSLSNDRILLRRACFLCLIMTLLQKPPPKVKFHLLVRVEDLTLFALLEMLQRKRLVLAPRSKPVEGQENAPTTAESEGSSDEEVTAEPEPVEMSEKDAKKKIEEDIKEFSAVRNLDEAEVYFTHLPAKHHPLLVDKLISFAVESKEADAQLVSDFFSRASTKNLCTIVKFESGFAGVLEFLDDIAIDAPMAFKLMATMMKGPAFDDEQRTRLASKTDSAKLLGLLS